MKSLGVEIVIMPDKHNPISTCSLASGQLSAQHYLSHLLHQEEGGKGQEEEGGGGRGGEEEGEEEEEEEKKEEGKGKEEEEEEREEKEEEKKRKKGGSGEGGSQTRSQDKRSSTPPNLPATPMLLAHLLKPMLLLQEALSSLWGIAQYWLQPHLLLTH